MEITDIQLSGQTYNVRDVSATTVVNITQEAYNLLPSSAKTANILYNITNATAGDLSDYYTKTEIDSMIGDVEQELSEI
jgi:hypothetical protein